MNPNLTLRYCVAGAFLLQGCATSTPPQWQVQPTLQVRHGTNETAEAYYQLGRTHQQQGNLELALTGYTYAIARDPRHLEARSAAAAIHAQQGRLDQARAMMLAVIADHPSASQAHNNLGYIDYLRGDHASAVQEIRQALVLDPLNRRAQNNLRLADDALALAAAAPLTPPLAPAAEAPVRVSTVLAPPAPINAEVAERVSQLELIQVIPNVYELKLPKALAPAPQVAALPATVYGKVVGAPASTQLFGSLLAAAPKMRVDVANADGTPGLARRVGALLGQRGFPVARLSNERPFGQRITRIQYRSGYAPQAAALAKAIDGPVLLAPVESLAASADVRVVLGRDTQRALVLRDAADSAQRLATR
jgi:tetratricopeptide (TPR) repeat protein